MVNYRYIGQYVDKTTTSGCGGCGTLRSTTTKILNSVNLASIDFDVSGRHLTANPNAIYSFTAQEAQQIEAWIADKQYLFELVP